MPHISLHAGKPIHERTGRELVIGYVVIPVIASAVLIGMVGWNLLQFGPEYTWKEWLGVIWSVVVCTVLCIGLPATARKEWERRKQFGHSETDQSRES